MHNFTFFCLKKKPNQCIVLFEAQCYRKAKKVQEECFQTFFKYIFYIKICHAASNNGINLFKIIVINNRNYNLKGIIDNYDFCHNRAALTHTHTHTYTLPFKRFFF